MTQHIHELVGAVHLHSDYSDGTLSIPEIAAIAEEKHLDFLMFSDHNTLAPRKADLEGWYGNVLVLIGCELNDPDDRNHYLAFKISREIPTGQWPDAYVSQVRDQGGFGIIAHPAEKRDFSDAYPPYPWTAWDVEGFDGIEIWNQLSEWAEGLTKRNFAWRILHPLRSIRFPVWETLDRWDQLNRHRRVVGIGGIDVHGQRIQLLKFLSVQIYPYKVQFRSIRTHFLVESPVDPGRNYHEAEAKVYEALGSGRCFISNYSVGDARGFEFFAEGTSVFPMGSRISSTQKLTFRVSTPVQGTIRFLKNGHVLRQETGKAIRVEAADPGVYRVEVFRKGRGWIYSNPIVILSR